MGLILIRIYQYIGKMVTDFLGLSNRVNLYPQKFQGYLRDKQYSVIFSFASHWTDDEQLRPDFGEYIQQLHGLLKIVVRCVSSTLNPRLFKQPKRVAMSQRWTSSSIAVSGTSLVSGMRLRQQPGFANLSISKKPKRGYLTGSAGIGYKRIALDVKAKSTPLPFEKFHPVRPDKLAVSREILAPLTTELSEKMLEQGDPFERVGMDRVCPAIPTEAGW